MTRPLSLPSPISQCRRSSGGRRGIPNMLNVCSLISSSWALGTSWGRQEGVSPGYVLGTQTTQLGKDSVCVCVCVCANGRWQAALSVSEDPQARGTGIDPGWYSGDKALLEHVARTSPAEGPWTEASALSSLTRKIPSRALPRQNP